MLTDERHGRSMTVTIDGSKTETHVAASSEPFELKGHAKAYARRGRCQHPWRPC
jgi:hypothetical protein